MKDNGTRWIAEYCDKEKIPYPAWLGISMLKLPRRVVLDLIELENFFEFNVNTFDEEKWAKCIIWIIENLESRWDISGHYLWIETEEDAIAFKLGWL